MLKFRKKPVVIEAMQLTIDNMLEVEDWCRGQIKGISLPVEQRVIDIQTLEGESRASIGDWVIKGIKGEFYPCKPGIFKATYEPVDPRLMEECPETEQQKCQRRWFHPRHKFIEDMTEHDSMDLKTLANHLGIELWMAMEVARCAIRKDNMK